MVGWSRGVWNEGGSESAATQLEYLVMLVLLVAALVAAAALVWVRVL